MILEFLLEHGQKAVGFWREWIRKGWLSTIIRARFSSEHQSLLLALDPAFLGARTLY